MSFTMGTKITQSQVMTAQPCQLKPMQPEKVAECLKATMAELKSCQSDSDIQRVAGKVERLLTSLSNGTDRQTLMSSMKDAKSLLLAEGQTVKAERIGKMLKLLAKLPKQSVKKQRKTLREILTLVGKNVDVNIGKRGLCGFSLCCNATVLTGSILLLAGATAVIAMVASGTFDETIVESAEGIQETEHEISVEEGGHHDEAAATKNEMLEGEHHDEAAAEVDGNVDADKPEWKKLGWARRRIHFIIKRLDNDEDLFRRHVDFLEKAQGKDLTFGGKYTENEADVMRVRIEEALSVHAPIRDAINDLIEELDFANTKKAISAAEKSLNMASNELLDLEGVSETDQAVLENAKQKVTDAQDTLYDARLDRKTKVLTFSLRKALVRLDVRSNLIETQIDALIEDIASDNTEEIARLREKLESYEEARSTTEDELENKIHTIRFNHTRDYLFEDIEHYSRNESEGNGVMSKMFEIQKTLLKEEVEFELLHHDIKTAIKDGTLTQDQLNQFWNDTNALWEARENAVEAQYKGDVDRDALIRKFQEDYIDKRDAYAKYLSEL